MSTRKVHRLPIAAVAAVALFVAACGSSGGPRTGGGANTTSPGTASSSTPTTTAGSGVALGPILIRAVTEERHAQATYANVTAALGDISPFVNITASEATHVAALEDLAAAHAIDVSAATSTGEPSPATKAAACQLGVDAEIADVALYDELLPQVTAYPDVTQVLTNLRAASQDNHLPAFQRCS